MGIGTIISRKKDPAARIARLRLKDLIPAERENEFKKDKKMNKVACRCFRLRKIGQPVRRVHIPLKYKVLLDKIRCCIFRMPSDQSSETR